MPGLKTEASVQLVSCGHAFVQNLRRGRHEFGVEFPPKLARPRLAELASVI